MGNSYGVGNIMSLKCQPLFNACICLFLSSILFIYLSNLLVICNTGLNFFVAVATVKDM